MDDQPDKNEMFSSVPIEVTISVGKARPQLREIMGIRGETVLPLDRRVDDPVELYVGDRLIARGELLEMDGPAAGQLAVRITDVTDLAVRLP